MEQTTNDYKEENSNESQTWDLSVRPHANQEANINLNTAESLILDLSCKKRVMPMLTKELVSSISLASSLVNQQYQQPGLPDAAQHSPIAGIPSVSEPDLPKNTKYEPTHDNNLINNNLPVVSSSTAMISHEQMLLLQPRADIIHIPVATFPVVAPNIPMPYADVQFNEAINTMSPTALSQMMPSGPLSSKAESSSPSPGLIRKTQRPFKAYPKNPYYFVDSLDYLEEHEKYDQFREKVLINMKSTASSNPKMRRVSKNFASPTSTVVEKDAAYLEKRKKNNEAAKRSRDNRKAKEDELAIRVVYLEKENMILRNKIKKLKHFLIQRDQFNNINLDTSDDQTFY
ncbi:transcription factor atf-2 [Linepithema humile]|uniref:transcription factor atf-2 n=1 Tax=Linepithema humile TaxID=83485 RepID=UPI0006235030|nr:PREDICTED: uncharacterized protein LOC105676447 [Linepithema humile]